MSMKRQGEVLNELARAIRSMQIPDAPHIQEVRLSRTLTLIVKQRSKL